MVYKQSNTAEYNIYRSKVNRMGKHLRYTYYENKVADLKSTKPTKWWKDVKLFMGEKYVTSESPMHDLANKICDGNIQELTDKISSFLTSLCDHMPPLTIESQYAQLEIDCIPDQNIIDVIGVEQQLSKLNTGKSSGPDQLPTWILKAL